MHALLLSLLLSQQPFDLSEQKVEPIVASARADARDNKIAALEKELEQLRQKLASNESYAQAMKSRVDHLEDQPLLDIGLLSKLQPIQMPVQIVITTCQSCGKCPEFLMNIRNGLPESSGWTMGDESCIIYVEHITDEEWQRRGYSLPHVAIRIRDKYIVQDSQVPATIANAYNAAVAEEKKMPKLAGDQLQSMKMTTIKGKAQMIQILEAIEPFLDGGTLQFIYTAKPTSPPKEWLTIKRGSFGAKIPSKFAFTLQMKSSDLAVTFQDPKPELILGPLQRGILEADFTPNKISLRLPWMIDPEIGLE